MSATGTDQRVAPAQAVAAGSPPRRGLREWAVHLGYLVLATYVLIRLWGDPNGRVLSANPDDHGLTMVLLAHGERVLFHGADLWHSDRLNVPVGVNMMANTSMLALSLPFAPLTHVAGVGVTVAALLTLGLAGTASAWYFVLSRHLVRSRAAAWIGGLWCGFCPAMISHASGHVNFVCGFVVPFLVWQVLRLREPGRVWRGGVAVGLLVVLQAFINEESLLFTALTLGVFVLGYAVQRRAAVRELGPRFLAGLAVAVAVAGVLLAYPIAYQFFAPGSYHGQPFQPDAYVTDLLSVGAYARQSVAGTDAVARWLSTSATEDNTFFGLPMVILLVIAAGLLWRSVAARATIVAGLVLLVASLGPRLRVAGVTTGIPLPFALVSRVPVIDLVSVTRFAMVSAVVAGVVLALAVDRMLTYPSRVRLVCWLALAVALVPVLPTPLPVEVAPPLPAFLADGRWRAYVPAGRSLVTVPLPDVTTGRTGMRWAALSGLAYPSPRGYFMGPARPPLDDTGSWSAPRRPSQTLLVTVAATGTVPVVTGQDRLGWRHDLDYWRAAVVVLVPDAPHPAALRATLTALFQTPPTSVDGVELWTVQPAG